MTKDDAAKAISDHCYAFMAACEGRLSEPLAFLLKGVTVRSVEKAPASQATVSVAYMLDLMLAVGGTDGLSFGHITGGVATGSMPYRLGTIFGVELWVEPKQTKRLLFSNAAAV